MANLIRRLGRWNSPQYFFHKSKPWVWGLYILGISGLIVGSIWGLGFVPAEKYQGDSFRIMFVHVPSAHLAELVYVVIALAGIVFLVWRIKLTDIFMAAAAPVGCVLTLIALITGMLWGAPTWGTAWVWDARTTSTLVLLFLFFGLIALRQVIPNPERASFASSVLAIIGVINIPIIKFSVEWFETLHQPSSFKFSGEVAIATTFLYPLIINICSMYLLIMGIILAGMRVLVLENHARTTWIDDWLRQQRKPRS